MLQIRTKRGDYSNFREMNERRNQHANLASLISALSAKADAIEHAVQSGRAEVKATRSDVERVQELQYQTSRQIYSVHQQIGALADGQTAEMEKLLSKLKELQAQLQAQLETHNNLLNTVRSHATRALEACSSPHTHTHTQHQRRRQRCQRNPFPHLLTTRQTTLASSLHGCAFWKLIADITRGFFPHGVGPPPGRQALSSPAHRAPGPTRPIQRHGRNETFRRAARGNPSGGLRAAGRRHYLGLAGARAACISAHDAGCLASIL
jgi:hypothetical protein